MYSDSVSNTYAVKPFMQGGRPVPVEEATIEIRDNGDIVDPGSGRDGTWTTDGPFLVLNWQDSDVPEKFCAYASDVTTDYAGHLFAYGKVLIPGDTQFELPLDPVNDNPSESLNDHVASVHPGCKRILSRASTDFFAIFPQGGKFLEVGVGYGNNAERFYNNMNPGELHLVDCWEVVDGASDHYTQTNLDDAYSATKQKFAHDPNVVLHKSLSGDALSKMQPGYFDMAYIDADHTEEACMRDLLLAEPLIKPGGHLCGHDYTEFPNTLDDAVERENYGVMKAVDRFCAERGWKLDYLTIEVHDWCFPTYVLSRK